MTEIKLKKSFSVCDLYSGVYSFINPASIGRLINSEGGDDLVYFIDGGLLAKIISFLTSTKIERVSMDFTSIAGDFFAFSQENKKKVYIFGAKSSEVELFCKKIMLKYPDINIVGRSHGYVDKKDWDVLVKNIKKLEAEMILVGLGTGMQEDFLKLLSRNDFNGTAFSCGGFIRQESSCDSEYYPNLVNKLNLRWAYRMYKEPHTIKRYLFEYPKNIFYLLYGFVTSKIIINVGQKNDK